LQALLNYDKYAPYIDPKIEQMIVLANKQLRLFDKHYRESVGNEPAREQARQLFRAVGCVLIKCFKQPQIGKRISRDTLRELITHILPFFIELRNEKDVFNSVNVLISELIKGTDATNLLTALMRMMHDYVSHIGNGTSSPAATPYLDTYLELTMKFIWRLLKNFDQHKAELNVDVILLEAHLFFKSFPRELDLFLLELCVLISFFAFC